MDARIEQAKTVLAAGLPGMFIAFEGPDGSGKSTQFRRLAALAREAGVTVCEVREPGGTPIGEQIRNVLLDRQNEVMCVRCEMLLYMASRAQLVEQTIRPALAAGQLVLADRFVASTLVYQGAAGGMGQDEIAAVAAVATGGLEPDLNVVFDVDTQTAMGRLSPLLDRMEAKGRAFHEKVRAGYQGLVQSQPDRYVSIDASRDPEAVWKSCVEMLVERVGKGKASGTGHQASGNARNQTPHAM
jgi:dTMP kinase